MNLQRLLAPRSIAVVGASPDRGKLAGRPLAYLDDYGFSGTVFAVNPKYQTIGRFSCVAAIDELPDGVDLALILVPAPDVASALDACGRRKIPFAISIASGFAEAGETERQVELQEICGRRDIRLIGPNCVGMIVPAGAVTATFSTELRNRLPKPGATALITQSGALGNSLLQSFNAHDVGLRAWISTGNEADLDVIALAEQLVADVDTRVVALFVEGFKDGIRLMPLAREARRQGKAIVVLRAGRSDQGRVASVSHTGKLAGATRVWRGLVRQGGLIEVSSLDEMLDLLIAYEALGAPRQHEPDGLGVLTISGGLGVLIADEAAERGLPMPRFTQPTVSGLRALLPPTMSVANPVDTALFTTEDGYVRCAELVLEDSGIGTLLLVLTSLAHNYTRLMPWLIELAHRARASGRHLAITFLSSSDQLRADQQLALAGAGALVLPSAERCVAALAQRLAARPADVPAAAVPKGSEAGGATSVAARAGVPEPAQQICHTLEEATAFAEGVGYPVALKVVSVDIPHKTEVGGVALGIADPEALGRAWGNMERAVRARSPSARIDGYQVQEMVTEAVELIVGCSHDREFGPVLMLGWGGIFTEVVDDVAFLALPATRPEIAQALEKLRVAKLLAGARGRPAADTQAAIDAVLRLSNVFLTTPGLVELDVNPLLVRPRGRGVVAVDLLAIFASDLPAASDQGQPR
jgi:acyl-CoA synthetase (NDP forming)